MEFFVLTVFHSVLRIKANLLTFKPASCIASMKIISVPFIIFSPFVSRQSPSSLKSAIHQRTETFLISEIFYRTRDKMEIFLVQLTQLDSMQLNYFKVELKIAGTTIVSVVYILKYIFE